MDTFICGACQGAFNDIDVFMQHKQAGCSRSPPDVIQVHVDGSGEVTEVTGAEGVMEDVVSTTSPSTFSFLNEMTAAEAAAQLTSLQASDTEGGTTHTYIILNETGDGAITAEAMQLESVSSGGNGGEEGVGAALATQGSSSSNTTSTTTTTTLMTVNTAEGGVATVMAAAAPTTTVEADDVVVKKTPGRRGRRPKKAGEVKVEPMEAVASSVVKPTIAEKDKDGKLRCPNCHRVFSKERHFKTHKCLASSLYIDISKREVRLDSGDEGELEETEAGAIDDDQEEYRAPVETEHSEDSEHLGEEEEVEGARARKQSNAVKNIQLHTDADTEASSKDKNTQGIDDVPIFRTDEEKIEFESTLNVDLSCIDHMFKVHVIDQDINENAGTYGRGQLTSLSLYSCTVCDKVFKTLSHMRLHCLVHTDLKPFRCNKCQYQTNTKGNLYTHMRKHTGQFYQCKHCEFRSVNKSHLVEHEATHDKKRHPCAVCQKDYATGKSLINHVRKYHANTRKGQQYLQTFLQGRQASGSTVIHQCHVCNRKFKKKIDRDRHLFVHDIRDVNMTHQCELCDYQASRRVYLEKHYMKHRILYCCSLCSAMFLSTVKLMEHLTGSHAEEQSVVGANDEELFERCINSSLYLPEPDEQMPLQDKQFVNLPPELSSSAVNTNATTTASASTEDGNAAGVGVDDTSHSSAGGVDGARSTMAGMEANNTINCGVGVASQNPSSEILSSSSLSVGGNAGGDSVSQTPDSAASAADTTPASSAGMPHAPSTDPCATAPDATSLFIIADGAREVTLSAGEALSSSTTAAESAVTMGEGSAAGVMEDGSSVLVGGSSEMKHSLIMSSVGGEEAEGGKKGEEEGMDQDDNEEGAPSVVVKVKEEMMMDVDKATAAEPKASTSKITVVVNKQGVTEILAPSLDANNTHTVKEEVMTMGDSLNPGEQSLTASTDTTLKTEKSFAQVSESYLTGQQDSVALTCTAAAAASDSSVPLAPNPGMASSQEDFEEMEEDGEEIGEELEEEDATLLEEAEEGEQTEEMGGVEGAEGRRSNKKSIVERLGFRPMNMQIFQKMRETFGSEECEFCGRLFYTKQDYEPHLRTHTGDRPFRCTECPFRAITRENLRRHMEREHEHVRFPCKDCDFVATNRTRLWNHQMTHLGISGLQCPHCPEKFETIKRLRVHMGVSHPDLPREELDKLTGYKHKMQGKMGRRSYKCPYCERVFIRANSELQKHIWIHEGVKPFKCSLCSYACRSKNNLQAHMLRHSSHKPFACQECGKAYKSKTALRWHVRSHKTGNLFKCDKCPYEAQQRSHLKRHMETHEVVKRFLCQHCDYSANTVGYMKIHYARTHKGLQYSPELAGMASTSSTAASTSDQQVFKCRSCDYRFGNLSDLKRHLRIKHHVQMQDFVGMDQMQISEVEVLQCATEETSVAQTGEVVEHSAVMGASETVSSADLDEKTVSAVNLLQQIIAMQNQQEIKVMSEDGQLLSVNPETIIVQQQDGHQVLVTNGEQGVESGGQYIIQYVAQDDPSADPSMEGVPMEIQTIDATESVEFMTG